MALENLFFKHDFNARNHPKLLKIKRQVKMEGVGIYWCLLEILYERNGYIKPEELDDICYFEHIDVEKAKQVMKLANFKKSEKGYYLKGVNERIEQREKYSKMQRSKANKRWKKETPVPEWHEEYEKEKAKDQKKQNEKEKIENEVIDGMPTKDFEEYNSLLFKSMKDELNNKEEEKLEQYNKKIRSDVEKIMDERKNPFIED